MSGAIFQGVVRNPLVSPDIIGIDAGASLFAVFWIVTGQPSALLPLAAFVGAVLAAAVIYVLTWKGGIDTDRLILVGIGVGAALARRDHLPDRALPDRDRAPGRVLADGLGLRQQLARCARRCSSPLPSWCPSRDPADLAAAHAAAWATTSRAASACRWSAPAWG